MAKLLQITFRNSNGSSEAAKQAAWERAHQIAAWPGIIWKIWIADPTQALYGGIYLFADEASVTAYLEGPVVASMKALPGSSEFVAHVFDINDALTAVTRGPLPASQSEA